MTRFGGITGRLGRVEAAMGGVKDGPCVLRVAMSETIKQAHDRYAVEWPNQSPGRRLLVVPAKPSTEEEKALWAERFREAQLALVANIRRETTAGVSSPVVAVPRWSTAPVITPNSPDVV
jgi:hypothetical protein